MNENFQQFVADTKQEIEEIVRMVVDVESKQVDADKLFQEISFVREKLEEFSHVESNSLELEEKVAELSSQILELQEERSNIGVGLEPLFRRVESLENSLQNLSGQIDKRINNSANSQQQAYEIFLKFAEDTKLEIQIITQKLADFESKQVEVHKLSQEISLLQKKLEKFFQDTEVKYFHLQEKVKNNLNLSQEWKEFFYISLWSSLGSAIILYLTNSSIDNPNIFLILLCLVLVLASPFLLTSLVIFFWSYFSIVLMFGRLFYSSPNLVLSKVDYWLSRYRFIYSSMEKMIGTEAAGQKLQPLELREPPRNLAFHLSIIFILCFIHLLVLLGNLIDEYINCSKNQEGWILYFLNAAHKQPELIFAIILFIPSITVSWFVIYWIILQFIKALALLKQKFIKRLK
ncbi:MAG: hypothetical protein WBA93_16495 [Microcoleaceae cyanobacterium]